MVNGSIVNTNVKASSDDNPGGKILSDLLVVLRAGFNKFGIVTRIDLTAAIMGWIDILQLFDRR